MCLNDNGWWRVRVTLAAQERGRVKRRSDGGKFVYDAFQA